MSDIHVQHFDQSERERDERDKRIARAKHALAALNAFFQTPRGQMLPEEVRGAFLDLAHLAVEHAQLSHARFDMYPFDLPTLVRRVDALEGLTKGKGDVSDGNRNG